MAMKRISRAPERAAMTMTMILLAAMLSTCGFLTSDTFPRWLSYVEASVDFRAIAAAQGLGDDANIDNLEFAPYVDGGTDYSKVLVFATGNGAAKLLMLDPERLSFAFVNTDVNFTRSLASTASGFLCGRQLVDPLNPENAPGVASAWTNPTAVRVFRVGNPGIGFNFAVEPTSSLVALFQQYPTSWGAFTNSVSRNYDSVAGSYNLIDADNASGYSVLARRQDNNQGYAASFPTAALFWAGGTVFDSGTAVQTGPFPVSDDRAWLTEGGPVALFRDKDSRLVRYQWGTGDFATGAPAAEIDSFAFDENDTRVLSFDPSGTWWFIYDRLDGRLYKLRTWW